MSDSVVQPSEPEAGREKLAFFATAAKGTEPSLRDELRALRLRGVRADRGGVHFAGGWHDALRAALWSRIAVRILAEVGAFDARDQEALYDGVRAIDWSPFVTVDRTLAIKATSRGSTLDHTHFAEQKAKDAIVDQIRERVGARPSVDLVDPDLRVSLRIARDRVTVYVDVSGESLHRRGWRTHIGEAPLKETLAAAMIHMSGWDVARPLVDPMCGSGTIAIEAALLAKDVAPNLARARFGLERWPIFDDALRVKLRDLRDEARERVQRTSVQVIARDVDPRVIEAAKHNAKAAKVDVRFEIGSMGGFDGTSPPGTIVTNPPYGERLEADRIFFDQLGDMMARLRDHGAAILAGTPAIARAIRRKPRHQHVVFNGAIECRLLVYDAR